MNALERKQQSDTWQYLWDLNHPSDEGQAAAASATAPTSEQNADYVLTVAQARYLSEIREAGEKRYNGRARRPLEALRQLGLIEWDFDVYLTSGGSMGGTVFIVRPTQIDSSGATS